MTNTTDTPAAAVDTVESGSTAVRYHPAGSARVRTGTGSGSFIAAQPAGRTEAWSENKQPPQQPAVNIPPIRDISSSSVSMRDSTIGHRRSPSSISDGLYVILFLRRHLKSM